MKENRKDRRINENYGKYHLEKSTSEQKIKEHCVSNLSKKSLNKEQSLIGSFPIIAKTS